MLLGEELKTTFRWYDAKEKQTRFLSNCGNDCWYKLFMPYNSLLPFEIRKAYNAGDPYSGEIVAWKIYTLGDAMAYDLTVFKDDIVPFKSEGAAYFVYAGNLAMVSMQQGFYYSVISLSSGGQFFSEVFFVDRTPGKDFLKFRWYNSCDIGNIVYSYANFQNELWLDTPISRNEPSLDEEGIENGEKQFVPTVQYYKDNFTVDEIVPEYIVSALTLVNMHDNILVSEPNSQGRFVRIINFKATHEWVGSDCSAIVTCKFQREKAIVKSRCCANQQIVKSPSHSVASLSNVSFTYGLIPGFGPGYQIQWTPSDPSKITSVEIKGNFHRQGDEIVEVFQPANSKFISTGLSLLFDISLEITPVREFNGRLRMYGDTVLVTGTRA